MVKVVHNKEDKSFYVKLSDKDVVEQVTEMGPIGMYVYDKDAEGHIVGIKLVY